VAMKARRTIRVDVVVVVLSEGAVRRGERVGDRWE
jgi:hypothetical protein